MLRALDLPWRAFWRAYKAHSAWYQVQNRFVAEIDPKRAPKEILATNYHQPPQSGHFEGTSFFIALILREKQIYAERQKKTIFAVHLTILRHIKKMRNSIPDILM